MPSRGFIFIFFLRQFFSIRQHFKFTAKSDNRFGNKLVIHIVIHRNPVSVIDTLTLRPNLLTGLVFRIGDFRGIPSNEINPF